MKLDTNKIPNENRKPSSLGFSLLEMLMVISIVGVFSSLFIINFRSSSTNTTARHQVSSIIVSNIRNIQSMALSGTQFNGQIVCGYGIHYLSQTNYLIYTRQPDGAGNCTGNVNYSNNSPTLNVNQYTIGNSSMIIRWSPNNSNPNVSKDDIFFQPPDPKVFIDNKDLSNNSSYVATIDVVLNGQNCPSTNCTTITIYKSGKIDVTN